MRHVLIYSTSEGGTHAHSLSFATHANFENRGTAMQVQDSLHYEQNSSVWLSLR